MAATLDDVVSALNTINGTLTSMGSKITSNTTATNNKGDKTADASRYITDSGNVLTTPYSNVQKEFVVEDI